MLKNKIHEMIKSRPGMTAKEITTALSLQDFPTAVITELNDLRTDGVVEVTKDKDIPDFLYWLADNVPSPVVEEAPSPEVKVKASDLTDKTARQAVEEFLRKHDTRAFKSIQITNALDIYTFTAVKAAAASLAKKGKAVASGPKHNRTYQWTSATANPNKKSS